MAEIPATAHAWLLEADLFDSHLAEELVMALQATSPYSVLLSPGGQTPLQGLAEVRARIPRWPGWSSRPWVIAGGEQPVPQLDGLSWLKDGKGFDALVAQLLAHVDWAFFSYFTTYAATHFCLLSREALPAALIARCQPLHQRAYRGRLPLSSRFGRASFYEPEQVGLLACRLAQACEQAPPLLLCVRQLGDGAWHSRWEADGRENPDWFVDALQHLPTLLDFQAPRCTQPHRYTLHQVTDLDAYALLWAEADQEHSLTEATLSADTDLERLQAHLSNTSFLDLTRLGADFGSWSYGLVYGGGPDEYHALFHARDPAFTTWIWEQARAPISRF